MLGRVITCNHGQNTMEKTLTTSKSFKPKLNIKQKKKKTKVKREKRKSLPIHRTFSRRIITVYSDSSTNHKNETKI